MRKFGRIIKYFLLAFIIFLLVLAIGAKLAENTITRFVTDKISQSITAPISIKEASFTLIRRFPLSTVEFKGITLGSHISTNDSISTNDTLASIEQLYVSVRSKELFDKKIEIVKIEINGAKLTYQVDSSGISNFDFLTDTTKITEEDTTESAPLNLALNQLLLKNITLNYRDEKLKASARTNIPEIKISGNINEKNYDASIKGNLLFTDCAFQETPVCKMQSTNLQIDLDYIHDSVFINEFEILTDGAEFYVNGNVFLNDKIPGNLDIIGKNLNIKELLKYAPDSLLETNGVKQFKGILNLNASVKGELADSILPHVTADFQFNSGIVKYLDYPIIQNIRFSGNATNGFLKNNKTTQASIENFHFETKQSSGDLSVSVQNLDQLKYKLNSQLNLKLEEFNEFIPDSLLESIGGKLVINLQTAGELPKSIDSTFTDYLLANTKFKIKASNVNIIQSPEMRIDSINSIINYIPNIISVSQLGLKVPGYNLKIHHSNLYANYSGSLLDQESLQLNLESIDIRTPESFFRANASINNLIHPTYVFNSHIGFSLQEWLPQMPDSLINNLTGNVLLDFSSQGTLNLDSIPEQIIPILFNKSSLALNLDNLSFDMTDTLMNVSALSGGISLENGRVSLNKFKGEYMNIPWSIDSTIIENIYPAYFLKTTDTLKVYTKLGLGDISYAAFAPMFAEDTTQIPETNDTIDVAKDNFDLTYEIKGKMAVNSFTYDKALLRNISSKFNIKNNLYIVDQLKLEAFDGSINSSIRYDAEENNISTINMYNDVKGMNIKDLLYDFDNFDQNDITHENISGLITTKVHTLVKMIGDSVVTDDIKMKGEFTIENGGIYDYAPLRELPKITSLDELEKIEFKTITTKVFIMKSGIYVPETYISSTAFDISAFGKQTMNDDFEYHLQLHLKDFLMEKSKKLVKEQAKLGSASGDDQRSTMNIFSKMEDGETSNGFDNDKDRRLMGSSIKTQETWLNLKFHPKVISYETGVK